MTAISPLDLIHKKGLFGDHHKKNESDLLNICEIKDLIIIQIVQYTKSFIKLKDIEINGLEFPSDSLKVSSNDTTRILWNAPKTWLIISKDINIMKIINKKCNTENFAITDISHSKAIIQLKGNQSKEVLKKGCPINFNNFEKNSCGGSVFHGISFIVDYVDDKPQTFNLITLRSFGESFYHHITDSALEFGYIAL